MHILFDVILTETLPDNAATYRSLKKLLPSVSTTVKSEMTTNYGVIFGPLVLKLFSQSLD